MGLVACGWRGGGVERNKGERSDQIRGGDARVRERRGPRHFRPRGPRCPGHGRDAENNLGEAAPWVCSRSSTERAASLREATKVHARHPDPTRRRGPCGARPTSRAGRCGLAAWLRGRRKGKGRARCGCVWKLEEDEAGALRSWRWEGRGFRKCRAGHGQVDPAPPAPTGPRDGEACGSRARGA